MKRILATLLLGLAVLATACGSAPERRDAYMQKARAYYEAGKLTEAKLELRNALKIDPKHARGFELLGLVHLRSGAVREAFQAFSAAIELQPELVEAQVGLGKIFLAVGENERAHEKAGVALGLDPNHVEARLLSAATSMRLKRYEEAESGLKAILTQNPGLEEAHGLMALSRDERGDRAGAVKVLQEGLRQAPRSALLRMKLIDFAVGDKNFAEAERLYEELSAAHPNEARLQLSYARFLAESGRPELALQRLKALDASSPAPEYKLAIAGMLAERGQLDEAQKLLAAAVQADPKSYDLRFALAEAQTRAGAVDAAIKTLDDAAALDPKKPKTLEAKRFSARVLASKGQTDKALTRLNEIFEKNPNDVDARFMRGTILLGQRKPADAIQDFRIVLRENPRYIPAHAAIAKAYFQNNEPQQAAETLRAALAIEPAFDEGRLALAEHYQRNGEWDLALEQIKALQSRRPDDFGMKLAEGDLKVRRKRLDEARAVYERLSADPANGWAAQMRLGRLDASEGKDAAALARYRKAFALKSEGQEGLAISAAIAESHLRQKQPDEALKFLESASPALKALPGHMELRARVAFDRGNLAETEQLLKAVIAAAPERIAPHQLLGMLYIRQGRVEDAVASLEKVAAEKPAEPSLRFLLGVIYQERRETGKAEEAYRQALQLQPDYLAAANNLAYLYAEGPSNPQLLAQALDMVGPAAATGEPSALDTQGWLYFRMGNLEMAVDSLQKASDADPGNPTIAYHAAKALAEKGKRKLARSLLERSLASPVEFKERTEAEALMKTLASE